VVRLVDYLPVSGNTAIELGANFENSYYVSPFCFYVGLKIVERILDGVL
jgi:hypothetical protein